MANGEESAAKAKANASAVSATTTAYESMSQLIKRASVKTLTMKTDQVKLFNRINHEMSLLLSKAQEIIRICLSDRNDFIIQAESLQDDYDEMNRILDENFSFKELSSRTIASQKELSSSNRKSNLKKLLNGSISSDDEIHNKSSLSSSSTSSSATMHSSAEKKRKKKKKKEKSQSKVATVLSIPDTCFPHAENAVAQNVLVPVRKSKLVYAAQMNAGALTTIRDTLDTKLDEIFGNEPALVSEPHANTRDRDIDETCIPDSDVDNLLLHKSNPLLQQHQQQQQNVSTPLAVKKQLQEHGLLDLTSSSNAQGGEIILSRENSPLKKHEAPLSNAVKEVETKKGNVDIKSTPVKYIQQKFSTVKTPVKHSGENSTSSNTAITQTMTTISPKKLVLLKTPQKLNTPERSQSIITLNKKSATETPSRTNQENEAPTGGGDDSMDYSFEFREAFQKSAKSQQQQQQQKQQTAVKKLANAAKKTEQASRKSSQSNRQSQRERDSKRFKQLTMTQAFAAINDTSMTSSSSSTCKPTLTPAVSLTKIKSTNLEKEQSSFEASKTSNLNRMNVKNEPIIVDDIDEEDFSRSSAGSDSCKSAESKAANEVNLNRLQDEYFADYEKVPKKKSNSPKYKHVQVVRKHDDRKKLNSFTCRECENYWKSVPEDKRPKRMEDTCRHRAKYQPPPTPEHYWSIAFPSTQECIERGYGGVQVVNDAVDDDDDNDEAATKRPRRKRPLQLVLNKNGDDGDGGGDENTDPDFNQLDFDAD